MVFGEITVTSTSINLFHNGALKIQGFLKTPFFA